MSNKKNFLETYKNKYIFLPFDNTSTGRYIRTPSRNIINEVEKSKSIFKHVIKTEQKDYLLLILRLDNKNYYEYDRNGYLILLYEFFSPNQLKLVFERNLNFNVQELILYNKNKAKRKVKYRYFGTFMNVHKDYRGQDMLLFSYYIYALILSTIEKVDNIRVKNKVYLEALDQSTISENTKHVKCPYCPYFDEVIDVKFSNFPEESVFPETLLDRWFNHVGSVYLNPEKRKKYDDDYDGYRSQTPKNIILNDGLIFSGRRTAKHIHLENETEFRNSVMEIYRNKLLYREIKLGVQLISACEKIKLGDIMLNSELAINFKTLAETEKQLGIIKVPANIFVWNILDRVKNIIKSKEVVHEIESLYRIVDKRKHVSIIEFETLYTGIIYKLMFGIKILDGIIYIQLEEVIPDKGDDSIVLIYYILLQFCVRYALSAIESPAFSGKEKIVISCLSKRLTNSINPVLGYGYSGIVNNQFNKASSIIGDDKNFQYMKWWSMIRSGEIQTDILDRVEYNFVNISDLGQLHSSETKRPRPSEYN